ncbi:MAG: glycosyltransferase family A protein [Chthoniobacteraceae bacterium]
MIRFSVIIPSYNRSAWLVEALESVFAQTEPPFEIVVADDGSTDDTLSVLKKYEPRVKVLTQSNAGPAAARNLGIGAATGDYIAFLDSDDLWFPWTIALYREVIEKHAQPAMIEGAHVEFDTGQGPPTPAASPLSTLNPQPAPDYLASPRVTLWPSGTAIRTEVLKAAGGFTPHAFNAEDCDLWLRLGMERGFVHIAQPFVFAYRRHPASAVSSLEKSTNGIMAMIECEARGGYPGGDARRGDRLRILTTHTRPLSVACAKRGLPRESLMIYRRTFAWNLSLGRWRYLFALPCVVLLALLGLLRGK